VQPTKIATITLSTYSVRPGIEPAPNIHQGNATFFGIPHSPAQPRTRPGLPAASNTVFSATGRSQLVLTRSRTRCHAFFASQASGAAVFTTISLFNPVSPGTTPTARSKSFVEGAV